MSDLGGLENVEFAYTRKSNPIIDKKINNLSQQLKEQGKGIDTFYATPFKNPDFYNALPQQVRENDESLLQYLENTARFNEIITKERTRRFQGDMTGLLAEEVTTTETTHADKRARRIEAGHRVNVDYLYTIGVNPSKVLFFRVTQPSTTPKPEYYWTSDLFETIEGLHREIPPEHRKKAIVLICDLQTINENGGLIQDINDDSGLSVRQIGIDAFDQNKALGRFST